MTGFVTRQILCVPVKSSDGQDVTRAIQLINKKSGDFGARDQDTLNEMHIFCS